MTYSAQLAVGCEPIPGYLLRRRLGAGGFGEVWEATAPDGQPLALKFLSTQAGETTTQELRALQAIRQLSHPNLLRIDQVWCHQNYLIISMELADASLADLLEIYRGDYGLPLPPEHACHYLTQAAKALDFLNARQHEVNGQRVAVQHCDVKPSNLLLFGNSVKVADYGLSAVISTSTKSFRKAGTLDYCAPEVFQGVLSRYTDQYALAVTYCLLRCGQFPFPDTPKHFNATYVRPAPDLSLLTPAERPLVVRALLERPDRRWPSCGELMYELSRAVQRQPIHRTCGP